MVGRRAVGKLLWLLALALWPAAVCADEPAPLVQFTFDTGTDSWKPILGSEVFPRVDRGRGVPRVGEGCLRFDFRRSDAQTLRGVESPPLSIPKRQSGPVLFRFWVRSETASAFGLIVRTHAEASHQIEFQAPLGRWTQVSYSSEVLWNREGRPLDVGAIRDVMIWCAAPPKAKETTVWIDDFRVDPVAPGEASGPPAGGNAIPSAAPAHPRLGAALDWSMLRAVEEGDAGVEAVHAAVRAATRLGFGMAQTPRIAWGDVERSRTVFAWRALDAVADAARAADAGLVACLPSVVDGSFEDGVSFPADMRSARDFADLGPRYLRLLELFHDRYADTLRCVVLRSDRCGAWFQKNPERVKPYREFVRTVIGHWRTIAPRVPCALGFDFHDPATLVQGLSDPGDTLAIVFDPAQSGVHPSYLLEEIVKLKMLTIGRSLALLETTYPSSKMTGQNEEMQAQYLRALFDGLAAAQVRMAWLTWWSLRDDDAELWKEQARVLGGAGAAPNWLRGRSSCGLLRRDDSEKPAAAVLGEMARRLAR